TAAMPLVLLVALFLLIIWALGRHRREVSYILETHLPTARFIINNPRLLVAEMVTTINEADEFIMATGGRAREDKYLKAIENKILKNQRIEYWRVMLGERIHHRLHLHLEKLFGCPNVHIKRHKQEIYGHILVSEERVILFFADPQPGVFGSGQILTEPGIANRYKEFVLRLYGDRETQDINKEEIRTLCVECSSEVETASMQMGEGP
ncbi:hypothetical protein ACFLVN_06140, partial [Chloroflexota bacterium]